MFSIQINRFYYLLLSFFIILADQYSKNIINTHYHLIINKNFVFFNIDYVKNYGAAFNLLSGSRLILSLVSILVSIVLVYVILKKNNINRLDLLSYSFLLGGAIGNGIDRISRGFVIDFININFINFPVFNFADISINIGLILLLYAFIKKY